MFFNEKRVEAMKTGRYICDVCRGLMVFEDKAETILVCPKCGRSMPIERYGFASDEEFRAMYPLIGDSMASDEGAIGESYDEVYNELDRD